eukprot:5575368-Pyramimonas_sp.AAC.1
MVQAVAQKSAQLCPPSSEPLSAPVVRRAAKELAITAHEFWVCKRTGEHRCAKCNHYARAEFFVEVSDA